MGAHRSLPSRCSAETVGRSHFSLWQFAGDTGLQPVLATFSGDARLWFKVSVGSDARALRFERLGN